MRDTEERGSWYLLTGLILGVILGVAYARFFQPIEYVDTDPATLRQDFKDQYRALIASAYLANGDLVRASARLELLKDADPVRALTEQAQRTLAQQGASAEARALGLLAIALGQSPPGPGQVVTQVPRSPTGTSVLPTPVSLTGPTLAASPETSLAATDENPTAEIASASSPGADGSFVLLAKNEVCDQPLPEPLIMIEVLDQAGNPLAGVLVIVTWAGGEERFFTGLKPELGPGYADFTLNPEFVYSLRLGEMGAPVGNLGAVSCSSTAQGTYWGAQQLRFGLQ